LTEDQGSSGQKPQSGVSRDLRTLGRASYVYFGQCLQAALMYRSALIIFVFSEAFAYAGFIAFWYKAATSNTSQTFYTPMALVLYFSLVSFHHGIQHHASSREIGSDIRLGKLAYSIVRPFPFLLQAALRSMAFTLTYSFLLSPLLVGVFIFVPNLWTAFCAGLSPGLEWQYPVALAIGLISGWLMRMVVGLLAFDMAQIWGPDTFFIAIYYAASGSTFPVDLLPAWALAVVKWTPMYYMVGFPVLTVMGRVPADHFQGEALRGVAVVLLTLSLLAAMWLRGIKRFEAIGI
jgi:ABC-2 type transport system permease protein